MIMRIVVVLPAPFGPMNPYRAPRGIVRSRPSTALSPANAFVTECSSIAVFVVDTFTPGRLAERCGALVEIDGELLQQRERHDLERARVRAFKEHARRHALL